MNNNYRLYNVLSNIVLLGALRVMYLVETGNSFTFIALLLSVKALSKLLFDLPIGLLVDRFGQKAILYFGNISRILTYGLLLLSPNPIFLIFSFIFLGINHAALELTEDCYVHDYGVKKEQDFLVLRGGLKKQQVLANILFNFFFAYAYGINIYLPILIVIVVSFLTLIPLLFIVPIQVGKPLKIKEIILEIPEIIKKPVLSYTFIYGICFLTIISLAIYLKFPVMEARGLTGSIVGYIDASIQLVAFVSLFYIKQIRDFTKNNLKEAMTVLLIIGLLISGLTHYAGLLILLITPMAFSLGGLDITKRIADYSNQRSKATYLAAKDFMVSLLIMLLMPLIGFITDTYSVHFSQLFLLLLLLLCLLFIKFVYRKQVFKNELANC